MRRSFRFEIASAAMVTAVGFMTGAVVLFACANGTDSTGGDSEGGLGPDGSRDVTVIPNGDSSSGDGSSGGDSGPCDGKKLVINELKVDGTTANDEMVELYNPGSCAVNLNGWEIKYQSDMGSAGPAGYKFANNENILAGGYIVLTPTSPSTPLKTGMAAAAGQIGLLDDKGKLVDGVAYGTVPTGSYKEKTSAPKPDTSGSIGRSPNGKDTNDNSADFKKYAMPSPGIANP